MMAAEGRASVRAWLYRVATGKRLIAPRDSPRRGTRRQPRPRVPPPGPARGGEPPWLQPYPDDLLADPPGTPAGPEARYEVRESVSLAFVAALQQLPPGQRAVLVLRDALGFRAAETADILDCSLHAADNALRRARATIARELPPGWRGRSPLPGSARERAVVDRFTRALERGDVDGMAALLTFDAWLSMPPLPFGYQGRAAAHFLSGTAARNGTGQVRLIATRANGQPAFGCYLRDPRAPIAHAHGLLVLTLDGDRICALTRFMDNSVLPYFGLPRTLPWPAGG